MIKKLIKANDQSGFVLIEMLMAIAISALVLVGIVEITGQTIIVNAEDTSRMRAVKQVENAIHWIERDAQMASAKWIFPKDSTAGFPLYLQWTGFEDTYTHKITYVLDSGALLREEVIEDDINGVIISETETFICDNIIESESNYFFYVENVEREILEVNLQVTVSDFRSATESRTLYVIPRVSN